MQNSKNSLIKHSFLFGALVGGVLILAALVFYFKDMSVNFDPQLRSINHFLIASGIFLGVRKYRDEELNGIINYGRAFGVGVLIIAIASLFYSIFIYILTTYFDSSMINEAIIFLEKELNKTAYDQKMIDSLMSIYKTITPGMFAFGQWFSKALSGVLFSLILAFFFKPKGNLFNKNSIDKFNESNK